MRTITIASFLLAVALGSAAEPAKPTAEDLAWKAFQKHVKELTKGKTPGGGLFLRDAPLPTLFPDQRFIVLGFPQFPSGIAPPPPLKVVNVFIVDKDDKVQHVTDVSGLEKFFKENLKASTEKDNQKNAAKAWLRLAEVLHQDGFYKFEIDENIAVNAQPSGSEVQGKTIVMGGGNGSISATLNFDKDGKLTSATVRAEIKMGDRPRCQATKLLDSDPIVRYMAEQSILNMGSPAKPYLDEQRAKASPELQKAIDKIWQRIVEEWR